MVPYAGLRNPIRGRDTETIIRLSRVVEVLDAGLRRHDGEEVIASIKSTQRVLAISDCRRLP